MPRPISNPPNPWSSTHVEWIGEPPPAALSVFEEDARSLLSENQSPDLPFRFSVNPYRGCMHACAYCYARPSHQYIGWGAGTDFDRKIVVKRNAPEVLRSELMRPSWRGDTIMYSGITDCYQPLEASFELTRRCLEVCLDFQNPVTITTKGALVRRDTDILAKLAKRARATVFVSIPFASDDVARKIEPYASRASRRFEAISALSDAGVTTGISVSPVIPGLTDSEIPELLERARAAGAQRAFMVLLRLPGEVLPIFDERLEAALPERAEKVRKAIREVRGGEMTSNKLGERFHGKGARWDVIERLFTMTCRRLGLNPSYSSEDEGKSTPFRRPSRQGTLFDL